MESITITIETTNAAFDGDYPQWEVARMLHELADSMTDNVAVYDKKLCDINGNTVGKLEVR